MEEKKCPHCGGIDDRNGKWCSKCLDKRRVVYRERIEYCKKHGLCPQCGETKLQENESYCPECRAKKTASENKSHNKNRMKYLAVQREYQREKRKWSSENGICVKCGSKKAVYGYKLCPTCREVARRWSEKNRSIIIDKPEGTCRFCGEKVVTGYKMCETHLKSSIEGLNSNNATERREKMKGMFYRASRY